MAIPQMTRPEGVRLPAKTVFAFQQQTDKPDCCQLFIYDDITKYGAFNWETWEYEDSETSAKHIRECLESVPEGAELEIHVNSNGGDAFEALTIYNLLCQYRGHKTTIVDGAAHSAAFYFLFCSDYRIMGQGTCALLHNMWTCSRGNAKQLRKAADQLDQMMASNRQIYLERAKGLTEEELIDLMDKETILTPQQCLDYGFCDEIRGYVANPDQQTQSATQQAAALQRLEKANEAFRQQLLTFSGRAQNPPENAPEQQGQEAPEQNGAEPPRQQDLKIPAQNPPEGAPQPNQAAKALESFFSAFLMATIKNKEEKQ